MPFTAPRIRSRTPLDVSSLAPLNRNATAPTASLPNWPGGTSPARHAATPNTNALEPLMRVRSRSKNAALGPVETYGRSSGGVGSVCVGSDSSDMAPLCKCKVVDAAFGNIELANYSFNRILATVARECQMESRPYLGVADFVTRRRALQHDHVLAARCCRGQMSYGVVERTAPHRLVDLGQLSCHSH